MATNPYFQGGGGQGSVNEQALVENLIIEAIKIYGHDVWYLPRTSFKEDVILGEDTLSRFMAAYPVEMYLNNVEGWEGSGELFSKFGINVTDSATFVVARKRWETAVLDEDSSLPVRPAEGDLLYFARTKALFEIKYVQHLNPFFQLGKFYVYSLQCELFQYSSERIETGEDDIDDLVPDLSDDISAHGLLLETGDGILTEDGSTLVPELPSKAFSDTEDFEEAAKDVLVFSVLNPFGEFNGA